jgi:propionate CoA-transferase
MAFLTQPAMFDFYDGGGLDLACLGMAQSDREGNINVSKLGPRLIGCGGFINITQSAKKCVFCGEFSAVGLDAVVENGQLRIRQEGKVAKFVEAVEQITFSGRHARKHGRDVLFVTERCVFQLVPEGLLLKEIAPGIDLQRDVLDRMGFAPIVPAELSLMDAAIFRERPMIVPSGG